MNQETMKSQQEEQDPVAEDSSEHEMTVISENSTTPVPTDINVKSCKLAAGQVCICETCEATRTRMIHRTVGTKRSLSVTAEAPPAKKPREEDPETLDKMSKACKTILECIGEDPDREGLVKTPTRWAKALLFMTKGYSQCCQQVTNGAVFSEDHDEMVVVRNIDIHSLCEHHMVPFSGRIHIGYIPNGRILGLSKLARIAEVFARRLQVQERLTRQIADAIVETVNPLGVAVVIECTHFCMVMRGVQKVGASTTTSSVRGIFESNPKTRAEFFSIIHGNGIKMC
jgi:GTP cyclohydrolase I